MQEYEKDGVKKTVPKIRVNQFDFGGGSKSESSETSQPKSDKKVNDDVPF